MARLHLMKRFVSEYKMRKGFTLIEVMVSVVIISVVVATLLKLFANNAHIFAISAKKTNISMLGTLLLGVPDLGYEKEDIYLDDIVGEFKVENELRQILKSKKVYLDYEELLLMDGADFEEEAQSIVDENELSGSDEISAEQSSGALSIEIGRTIFKLDDQTSSFTRIKLP